MFSWIVTKKLEKRIQYLLDIKKNSVFIGHKLIHRRFLCLVTRRRSQTQAFAVKLRKTLQWKRGALLSDISQVGEPTYLEKSFVVFAFLLNKVTLTKIESNSRWNTIQEKEIHLFSQHLWQSLFHPKLLKKNTPNGFYFTFLPWIFT